MINEGRWRHKAIELLSGVYLLALITGCGEPSRPIQTSVDTTDTRSKDLMRLVDELPGLSLFHQAVDAANYREMLEHTGPYTLFAPLDQGFRPIAPPASAPMALHPDTARSIVSRHMVRGLIKEVWNDSVTVSTLSDVPVRIRRRKDGQLIVGGHRILESHEARNGVIHILPNMLHASTPDTLDTLSNQPELLR